MLYVDDPIPALKRQLAREILALPDQIDGCIVGPVLGLDEPRLCDIQRGRLERLSLQQLVRALANVNRRVELRVVVVGSPRIRWWALHRKCMRIRQERRVRPSPG
jgi:predicted XRE-type DNA-binding protein